MHLRFRDFDQIANITQFQLRFSPALTNKPKSDKPSSSKPIDPFENPSAGLFVTELPPSHFLVLNKFPVIPNHFILATKSFKQQTDLLDQDDLAAAYACLKAYRDNGEELFGFFNSGDASGASQPHRHIQFLPVDSMRSGIQEGVKWGVLADSLIKTPEPGMN
jgi:ATP adenylyltransferase